MPIAARKDGTAFYQIPGLIPSVTLASNRQKKVLRLFDVHFGPSISAGAAGWEIAEIMSHDESREHWGRYLFLTADYGSETDQLVPHDPVELLNTKIPDD
jgi:hypothetical protein